MSSRAPLSETDRHATLQQLAQRGARSPPRRSLGSEKCPLSVVPAQPVHSTAWAQQLRGGVVNATTLRTGATWDVATATASSTVTPETPQGRLSVRFAAGGSPVALVAVGSRSQARAGCLLGKVRDAVVVAQPLASRAGLCPSPPSPSSSSEDDPAAVGHSAGASDPAVRKRLLTLRFRAPGIEVELRCVKPGVAFGELC